MIALHAAVLMASLFAAPAQDRPADCATVQDCRRLALEAADHQDFEAFHDLAWRAFRKGPKDPELMRLLARAQSLSGRPLDALVMLDRLLALGMTTDAATSEDFRRVRGLPGWADFEKRVADASTAQPLPPDRVAATAVAASPGGSRAVAPDPVAPAPSSRRRGRGRGAPAVPAAAATPATAAPISAASPSPSAGAPPPAAPDDAPVSGDASEALRFTTIPFTPAGLAYDRVSNRFIVGDHDARKLTVVDEASQRVANLAAAQSAGFGSIAAFEIDAREGDLWVVSSPVAPDAAAPDDAPATTATLHKLQLISGRVLYAVAIDRGVGVARFADVAVTPQSTILVLDTAGRRVFVAPVKARRLDLALQLTVAAPTSLAPESESLLYIAHADGILRADLPARRARALTAPASINLAGITRLRWHRGALLAVQATSDGSYRIVRLKLDGPGQRVTGVEVLDRSLRMPDPTAMSISGDVLYYLAAPAAATDSPTAQTIVRRVTVK